jgi:hypothetical protein
MIKIKKKLNNYGYLIYLDRKIIKYNNINKYNNMNKYNKINKYNNINKYYKTNRNKNRHMKILMI